MSTTPDIRLEDPDRAADCLCAELGALQGTPAIAPLQTITPEQLQQAVLQLRERRGRPAAEQMQAVLRALDVTVLPRVEHPR